MNRMVGSHRRRRGNGVRRGAGNVCRKVGGRGE